MGHQILRNVKILVGFRLDFEVLGEFGQYCQVAEIPLKLRLLLGILVSDFHWNLDSIDYCWASYCAISTRNMTICIANRPAKLGRNVVFAFFNKTKKLITQGDDSALRIWREPEVNDAFTSHFRPVPV